MAVPLRRIESKYEVVRKLKEGGMGAIYHVRHRLLGDERVIKIMRPHLEEDPSLRKRFEREARAASRLSHPNIAQLYDFTIDDDGFAYIVMEFIHGLSFEELIDREGLLPLPLVIEMADQGLRALGHLHLHGLVHRDISPDNLMLTRDFEGRPQVKLIDLGIAKATEGDVGLTATGMFVGKLRYASPEQFGEREAEKTHPRTDLYSFGLVLYELLTGQYPITGDNPTSIIAGHLFRPPLDFSESDRRGRIPEHLRQTVLHALAKAPEDRFESAESFLTELAVVRRPGDLAIPEIERILELVGQPRPKAEAPEAAAQAPEAAAESAEHATTPELDEVVSIIETKLDGGELPEAREALEDARRLFAGEPRLDDLADRLNEVEQITHRPRIRKLIGEAQHLASESEYSRALKVLREAMQLTPGDARVQQLLRETEKAVRQEEARQRRQDAIGERATQISRLLDEGELDAADRELVEAGERFGKHERWSQLRQRLDGMVQKARRDKIDEAVERVRGMIASHDWQDARHEVEHLLVLDPSGRTASRLREEIEEGLNREEERLRRQREIDAAAREIGSLIDTEDLDGAADKLAVHRERLGTDAAFDALDARISARRADLEERRRRDEQERRRRQLEELLSEAAVLSERGEIEEALEALDTALQLDPTNPDVEQRLAEARRRHEEQVRARQRAKAIAESRRRIEEHLEAGELPAADNLLQDAVQRFEEDRPFADLRDRLAEAQRVERDLRIAAVLEEARQLETEGDLDAAYGVLGRGLDIDPDDPRLSEERSRLGSEIETRAAQRDQALAQAAARIETALEGDDLEAAQGALAVAFQELGDDTVHDRLGAKVAEIERRRREAQIRSHIAQAEELVERGAFNEALTAVGRAEALDPEHPVVRDFDRKISALVERQRRQVERSAALKRVDLEVARLFESKDLDSAGELIAEADAEWGPDERLTSLQARLARLLKRRERQQRVRGLVGEAETLRAAGRLTEALERLDTALGLAPANEDLRRRFREVEDEVVRRRRQTERQRERLNLERELLELVEQERFEEAHEQLLAGAALGRSPQLDALEARIQAGLEERRQERLRDDRRSQANELVARARAYSQTEDFTAARRVLRQAAQLDPDHPEVKTLSHSVETLLTLQRKHVDTQDAYQRKVSDIRLLLRKRRPGEAMKHLQQAVERFGQRPELQDLRYETAQAFLEVEEEEESIIYTGDDRSSRNQLETTPIPTAAVRAPTPTPPPQPPTRRPSATLRSSATTASGPSADPRAPTPTPSRAEMLLSPIPEPDGVAGNSDYLGLGTDEPSTIDELPLAGMGMGPFGPALTSPAPQPLASSLPVRDRSLGFQVPSSFGDPALQPPPVSASGGSKVPTWMIWVLAIAIIALFLSLGLWLAGRDEAPTAQPAQELEVEDVDGPTY